MEALWAGFATVLGIWVVTVVTPGPNFLATVHATLARSRRPRLPSGSTVSWWRR